MTVSRPPLNGFAPYATGDFSSPAVISCSPRSGGNSDDAAAFFREGIRQAGGRSQLFFLRDFSIHPCQGCIRCAQDPRGECYLSDQDQSAQLFQALLAAPSIFISSPIYFYHVPAQFKAWIDRSQSYYLRKENQDPVMQKLAARPAIINLVAGRPQGERLFEGALLTLKYFLKTFNFHIQEQHVFRGIDNADDLRGRSDARETLISAGSHAWTQLSA
ncbi:Multimeric flavodoxin WrbA [Desulfonatronum thiosulfatophilum]|uniref:Multimeric flavodoxin WrbA n=1 Tax=Desulfonatronum thiosulfatophilum TaxID=617002 RepID=A0A1G6EHB9_9BACT|nr:flavodoxin family protein [Desulfonatronum thiosulfatophilum]SDB56766.1 Multimeric flavodoxin WrbA [Desulfonatronum thiosulfatophilum]